MQQEQRLGPAKRDQETSPSSRPQALFLRQQVSRSVEPALQGYLASWGSLAWCYEFEARLNVETSPTLALPFSQDWDGKK